MMKRSLSPRKSTALNSDFFLASPFDQQFREIINGLEDIWQGREGETSFGHIKESDNAYLLSIDMPGVKKEDIDIHVGENNVTVQAVRKTLFEDGGKETRKISKSVSIPTAVNRNEVKAQMQDGILYLALPKSEEKRSRKIEVSDASDSFVKLFADKKDDATH